MTARVATVILGVAANSTAVCMSVIGARQRGGWLAERLVWVAISVVLVFGVHLLADFAAASMRAAASSLGMRQNP